MGNSASTDAAHKENRLKNRFSRVSAAFPASPAHLTSSTTSAAAPRRSPAAKGVPEHLLSQSETRLHRHQDATSASAAQQQPLPSIAPETSDADQLPSFSLGQPRSYDVPGENHSRRTWSLGAHEGSSSQFKRTNSLTRTFSLSRARSLIHQRRPDSSTSESRPGTGHENELFPDAHALDLVAEQAAEENPYLRTTSSQFFEPSKQPMDVPKRPNSTGLPLLPRPNSETDMSLFTPARRRSLRTPGVATRAPLSNPGRTSKPTSRRNSLARPQPLPILEVSAAAEDDGYDIGLRIPGNVPRASTPNELDFAQVGAYKFGTLRITNGSPSATPDARQEDDGRLLGGVPLDYFSADVNKRPTMTTAGPDSSQALDTLQTAATLPEVERLDVRMDDHARSTVTHVDRSWSINRSDSGIETSPVRERPEMRLSKADSGYSSKASVRSSYSDRLAGKESALPRSSFDSTADGPVILSVVNPARTSPSPERQSSSSQPEGVSHHAKPTSQEAQAVGTEKETTADSCHTASQVHTPRTIHKLFSLSRRQSQDEGRPVDTRDARERKQSHDDDQVRGHYHWMKPVSSTGKGTLNSLFGLKRVNHEPIRATPFPPHKSKLTKENKAAQNMGSVGTNLVHAATAILPIKRTPTLHLKTELNIQLQQDDELYQDRRFSIATSPHTRTSMMSPTVAKDRPYGRQDLDHNVYAMPRQQISATNTTHTAQAAPREFLLVKRNSVATSESTRYAPPPVSLKTRHGGSFTSFNERRSRNSLPAQVERSISLDRSTQATPHIPHSVVAEDAQAYEHPTARAIPGLGQLPQSPKAPGFERRRSMVLMTGQGPHRVPSWAVEADHHTSPTAGHFSQVSWQEPTLPQIRRPTSASSFLAPRIPDKADSRGVLPKAAPHLVTASVPSQTRDGPFVFNPASQNGSRESIKSSLTTAQRPFSQPRGHSRNRSHGSFDRDGNPSQFRVLHSYNSPAYKHVPIWN